MEPEKTVRVPPLARAAVAVCSAVIPALGVYRVVISTPASAHVVPAIVATVVIVPVQVWLVLAASRGHSTAGHRWALAALAAIIVAMTPLVGVTWLGAVFPLSALILVIAPRPTSWIAFAVLVIAPIPLAYWFGAPKWAGYFAFGTLMFGLGVAVPIWLLAAIRELQQTRQAIAGEAVLRERLRIDRELGSTVGASLAAIASDGERASRLAEQDPAGASTTLRTAVDRARKSMADVRRFVRGYQALSVPAELRRMLRLLDAAGIRTRLVLPAGDLPASLDEKQRAELRENVASILSRDGVRECVCTVTVHNGSLAIDLWIQQPAARVNATAA